MANGTNPSGPVSKAIIPNRMKGVATRNAQEGKRLVSKRAKDVAQSTGLANMGLEFAQKPEVK